MVWILGNVNSIFGVNVTFFLFLLTFGMFLVMFLSQVMLSFEVLVILLWGWQFVLIVLVLRLEEFYFLRNFILDLGVGVWFRLDW